MSWYNQPDIWGVLSALIISTISGFISIARRILSGHPANLLWIISEFLTAILCGYLMYHAYPTLQESLPEWVTLPVAIAVAAHVGGRVFQELEATILRKYAELMKNQNDT
jgi:hypothetical protein